MDRDEVRRIIKVCLIEAMELDMKPEDLPDDVRLFASKEAGGLALDSLATLAMFVAVSQRFDLIERDVAPEVFESIETVTNYVCTQQQIQIAETERPA